MELKITDLNRKENLFTEILFCNFLNLVEYYTNRRLLHNNLKTKNLNDT